MRMIAITCHGAAQQVTGSCHLLECGAHRVLIDCGLFQGSDAVENGNAADFGFDPASIDFLLLTHAHLDHCGRIPLLVKRGFRGEIIATAPTRELARLVMSDAASLQQEDARVRSRQLHRGGNAESAPLYTLDDAFHAMDFFGRRAEYGRDIDLAPELRVRFVDAGHMLGSASVLVEAESGASLRRILFSGDIGNPGRPLLRTAEPPPSADVVVMEATYGDRNHRSMSASVEELVAAIKDRLDGGGNVIIPTFALERAQEVIFHLADAARAGTLPRNLHVFLDSPMAISATSIFARYPDFLGEEARARIAAGSDPFGLPTLRFTRDVGESMAINNIDGGAVILAGSGMCTGGRVRHHLKHNLWRENAGVVFVGYAAEGTPARRIIDGADYVRILGEEIRVRAKIWTINGFSAHAGQNDLLDWVAHTGAPRKVLLVHGEPTRGMQPLAERIRQSGLAVEMPSQGERVLLN
jgi:metallo-beta-lactamase family protein